MKHFLSRAINAIEHTPLTLASFVIAFFSLIIVRLTIENMLGFFPERSFSYLFFEFTHTFLFFLCSFILMIPLVRFAGRTEDIKQAINVLLFGYLIIFTPPIIDAFIFGSGQFWSFYEFDGLKGLFYRFFTLFGDTPDIGITYGVRIEVVITTLALGGYAYLKSKSLPRAVLSGLFAYILLFILGTFPSWISLGVLMFQKSILAVSSSDVAALFLTPENLFARSAPEFKNALNVKMSLVYGLFATLLSASLLLRYWKDFALALWKNARLPQLSYHSSLLFLGMALGFYFSDVSVPIDFFHICGVLVLLIAVECAWLASVIMNDVYDRKIDQHTNPSRPLIENTIPLEVFKTFGVLFFLASLLLSGVVSFTALLLLLAYQAIACLYSAWPFRLKRFPGIATLCAAAAGMLVLLSGYLVVSPTHTFSTLPWSLLIFFFASYALAIPIKDFKDIVGDALDRVYTLPVILGEVWAKHVIGSLLFLLYIGSPFILHIRSLFWPALLFGTLAFWTLQKGTRDERSWFSYRRIPAIILGITEAYGLLVVGVLIL